MTDRNDGAWRSTETSVEAFWVAVRLGKKKKGIRLSQGASAGVAFQPAVTVSGALA